MIGQSLASPALIQFLYLAAAALFVLSIKWMGHVKTARRGNWAGTLAMVLAVGGTLLADALRPAGLRLDRRRASSSVRSSACRWPWSCP